MEIMFSLLVGLGLSATSGFRLFVPFLIMSIASLTGLLELAPGFAWIGTYPALAAFAAATVIELAAYFSPYVDNLLSIISAPVAVIAGTVITASVFFETGPMLTWAVAAIAGGGTALAGKTASATMHAGSTTLTGGFANPVLSSLESAFSIALAVVAILVPVLVVIVLALFVYALIKIWRGLRARRRRKLPNAA
jgi:hypothetical protein